MYTRSHARNVRLIQRVWRSFLNRRTHLCPISLSTIPAGRLFRIGRQLYDASFLSEYLQRSGDYRCPMTRAAIAPHLLQQLEANTGVPVWSDRLKIFEAARAARERAELSTFYSNLVDRHVGACATALLDESTPSREVFALVIDSMRRLTAAIMQFSAIDRPAALMALRSAERTLSQIVTFHTISQDLATRFLRRLQNAETRRASAAPAPP